MIAVRRALAALALAASLATPVLAQQGGGAPGVSDMVLGDPDAPIKIVEYASLTCPHCAHFHNEILPQIKASYIDSGKARLVFRDFPLDRLALQAAAVARCGGDEKYFGFLEVLFRTQETWARSSDPIGALARVARLGGLRREQMEACIADKALVDGILAVRLEGEKQFKVASTPTFIINGEKVVGAQSFEHFKDVLDRMSPQ